MENKHQHVDIILRLDKVSTITELWTLELHIVGSNKTLHSVILFHPSEYIRFHETLAF